MYCAYVNITTTIEYGLLFIYGVVCQWRSETFRKETKQAVFYVRNLVLTTVNKEY